MFSLRDFWAHFWGSVFAVEHHIVKHHQNNCGTLRLRNREMFHFVTRIPSDCAVFLRVWTPTWSFSLPLQKTRTFLKIPCNQVLVGSYLIRLGCFTLDKQLYGWQDPRMSCSTIWPCSLLNDLILFFQRSNSSLCLYIHENAPKNLLVHCKSANSSDAWAFVFLPLLTLHPCWTWLHLTPIQ